MRTSPLHMTAPCGISVSLLPFADAQAEFEASLGASLDSALDVADGDGPEAIALSAAAGTNSNGYLRLLQTYSEAQRRRVEGETSPAPQLVASIREARDAVLAYRAAYLAEADWQGGLVCFWASVEALTLRSPEEARQLMEPLFSTSAGTRLRTSEASIKPAANISEASSTPSSTGAPLPLRS